MYQRDSIALAVGTLDVHFPEPSFGETLHRNVRVAGNKHHIDGQRSWLQARRYRTNIDRGAYQWLPVGPCLCAVPEQRHHPVTLRDALSDVRPGCSLIATK